jgi:twinkle protein
MNVAESISHLYGDTGRIPCPECSHERKKNNQKDCVVTRGDKGWVWHCHHCSASGILPFNRKENNVIPLTKPTPVIVTNELQQQHYDFLTTRGISKQTADSARLFSEEKYFSRLGKTSDSIAFPYYKDGKLVAAKYRAIESKDFTQSGGGAQEFFNIDSIDPSKPIVIVEGEIDALTLIEAGVENVLSVPSGAPMKVVDGKVDASEDRKFAFVWSAHEILKNAPYVVIATDTDSAGQALAEELARRIGKDKCRVAKFDYKDLNEAFLDKGADLVREIIAKAEPYPVAGLSQASKFEERLNDLWGRGTGKGSSTGYSNVDQIYTVAQGQLTIVTGYPSSGKSNFIDQLMVNLGQAHDWKFAVCSFENQPEVHISRLMELKTGRRFFEGTHRMTEEDRKEAFKWVNDHFIFLDSETVEPSTIEHILERAAVAVARLGIRGLVIDPYNYIDNKASTSETEFISSMLTRVQAFAKMYGVHVWFIAHPAKFTRSNMDLPRPDGMSISGSMAWWAKADCGITVHRTKTNDVEIAVWKCRYRWVGTNGETKLGYNKVTGSYFETFDEF